MLTGYRVAGPQDRVVSSKDQSLLPCHKTELQICNVQACDHLLLKHLTPFLN